MPLYATVIWLAWVFAQQVDAGHGSARIAAWEPYSAEKVAALTAAGKPVFVDFTAAWCVTCQVNERVVLAREDVIAAFRDRGVTLVRADWTRRDPEIARALAALGRSGVPAYVLYRPGGAPELLPELLTPRARARRAGRIESHSLEVSHETTRSCNWFSRSRRLDRLGCRRSASPRPISPLPTCRARR